MLMLTACAPEAPAPAPDDARAIIETVAGTGVAAFTGDLQPATESPLYAPAKVGFSSRGRPWIIDWNNHRVRELGEDGTLLTVVGTGAESVGQPNVLSVAFSIHHAFDLTTTPSGDVVFAGYHDPRIFSVTPRGEVRSLAGFGRVGNSGDGQLAFQAAMNDPAGVARGADGTLYFAEEGNHQVRSIDTTGRVRRVAGTGAPGYDGDGGPATEARLFGPTRIAVDAEGRLYICDTRNHVLRRVGTDGTLETIVGSGTPGYSGDGGEARLAELHSPYDLALGADGAILIADSGNHTIRRVAPSGLIETVAGTGVAGFSGDGGAAREARLDTPLGLTIGPDGTLWIADTGNHRVRTIAPAAQ